MIVVDAIGATHVVAAGEGDNRGIWYFTNGGGTWSRHRVSEPPPTGGPAHRGEEMDGDPSISVDIDGSVWIAFTRWECGECAPNPSVGTFYVTNVSGSWSDPVLIGGRQTHRPRISVDHGQVRVVYDQGMTPGIEYPVWYATRSGSDWSVERVARDGFATLLRVDAGKVSVFYATYDGELMLAEEQPDGSFNSHRLGPPGGMLVLDPTNGELRAVAWAKFDVAADRARVYLAERSNDGWSDEQMLLDYASLTGLALDARGTMHLLAAHDELDSPDALLYLTRAPGGSTFDVVSLAPVGGFISALAVDTLGRPAVVHVTEFYNPPVDVQPGLWFIEQIP